MDDDNGNERHGFRERFRKHRDREDDELQDWLNGPGATVFGISVAILAIWLLVRLVTA